MRANSVDDKTMELKELTEQAYEVFRRYCSEHDLKLHWQMLLVKIVEEVGEVSKASQVLHSSCRKDQRMTVGDGKKRLAEELADLVGICLVLAKQEEIDIETAFERKWFPWLERPQVKD